MTATVIVPILIRSRRTTRTAGRFGEGWAVGRTLARCAQVRELGLAQIGTTPPAATGIDLGVSLQIVQRADKSVVSKE